MSRRDVSLCDGCSAPRSGRDVDPGQILLPPHPKVRPGLIHSGNNEFWLEIEPGAQPLIFAPDFTPNAARAEPSPPESETWVFQALAEPDRPWSSEPNGTSRCLVPRESY